jgi:ribosomal-protein-alanine N-acetyltransferase
MDKTIIIDKDICLTKSSRGDKRALIEYLNDKEIFNQTLRIPFPYSESDAEANIEHNINFETKNNKRRNWVIRDSDNKLMGHIGLHYPYGLDSDKNEVYYWLGKPFRNKGIMTKVLQGFSDYCFSILKYKRLEAPIFDFNVSSANVLVKSGYTFEQNLPDHYTKGDKKISAKMYAKTSGHTD